MKGELVFEPPLLNAAGSLGFAPDPHHGVTLDGLGAFITSPISLAPRRPAGGRSCLPCPGGFLLHSGYPNPGLRRAVQQYGPAWERAGLPVLVHLLCRTPDEVRLMVGKLEGRPGVAGLELGLPPEAGAELARAMLQAALGELPVALRLPLERAAHLAQACLDANLAPAAFSLGPPRGLLPAPGGGLVAGRLYGPAVFPLALAALRELVPLGLPVIGAGGVYQPAQAEAMLALGAAAVQLDAVLWR